jgi:hypothetical protein
MLNCYRGAPIDLVRTGIYIEARWNSTPPINPKFGTDLATEGGNISGDGCWNVNLWVFSGGCSDVWSGVWRD